MEPATGGGFFLLLPGLGKEWFGLFLAELGQAVAGRRVGVVLDGSGSHRAAIPGPPNLAPIPLPPRSPELNPAEQVFRTLRAELANRVFEDLDELAEALTAQLRRFWARPDTLKRLTAYPWWLRGLPAPMPSPP